MKTGDKFTIAGARAMKRNPERAWWQLWKPRFVEEFGAVRVFTATTSITAKSPKATFLV